MIALAVDDEPIMLDALVRALNASSDIERTISFPSGHEALEWARQHAFDVAFLGINMRGIGGPELAKRLRELQPGCIVNFCTGYPECAVDAFRIHATGYLMKPLTAEAVQREIDHIKGEKAGGKLLTLRCFGAFEVFSHGSPLSFRRSMSKEVLAVLTDRQGARMTTSAIAACLWPERSENARTINYLYHLFADMRSTLERAGAGSAVIRPDGRSYALDVSKVDCDYYSYLKHGSPAFMGEYMSQYSWAEDTCGYLWSSRSCGSRSNRG